MKIKVVLFLIGLLVVFLYVVYGTIAYYRPMPGMRIRGGWSDQIIIKKQKRLTQISDFFRDKQFNFDNFSPDELMKKVQIIKRIENLNDGLYLLYTKEDTFLFGINLSYTDEDLFLLGIPSDENKKMMELEEWSYIFICEARPKNYFMNHKPEEEIFVYTTIALAKQKQALRFGTFLPPVPGCFTTSDTTKNSFIRKLLYPELAKKYFTIYYPELLEELNHIEKE